MTNGKEFIVEKLYRGSIINHNSFLMDDAIDTDAVCRTSVSLYAIDITMIDKLRAKYVKCERILHEHEMKLVNPKAVEPALDYILRDHLQAKYFTKDRSNNTEVLNYEREARMNKLNFKLKNAVMYHWLQV